LMIENKQFSQSARFYLFILKLETCDRDLLHGTGQITIPYLRPGISRIFAKLVKSKSMSW